MSDDKGLAEARAAKRKAKKLLEHHADVTGVGITRLRGQYAVKVLVASPPEHPDQCPDQIDGVPVVLQATGPIHKQ